VHTHIDTVICSFVVCGLSSLLQGKACFALSLVKTDSITMLGSDRFTFDSPNVIDPGDLPPSRPQRQSSINQQEEQQQQRRERRGSNTDSTDENSTSSDEFRVSPARESAARLLRDIEDIDHLAQDYDPYDEEEAAAAAVSSHEQLPSVEEARMYATSLLSVKSSDRRSPTHGGHHSSQHQQETVPLSMNRTIKLDSRSSKHLVRQRVIKCLIPFMVVIGLMGTTIALGLVLVDRLAEKDANESSDTPAMALSRYEQIVDFLGQEVSSRLDLETVGTPQEVSSTSGCHLR
jgi:hypothetical protein